MDKRLDLDPPNEGPSDHAHRLVRAALGSVPGVGSAAVELFTALLTPPLEKRRAKWMEAVATELQKLSEDKRISIEGLRANEVFLDVLLEASQAAIKTSQESKLKALQNAVLNAASPSPPDESRMKIYVRLVDELTTWHLRILGFMRDPTAWFKENKKPIPEFNITVSPGIILAKAFPELEGQREFYDFIWNDLQAKGLITAGSLQVMMTPSGAFSGRLTDLGDGFLKFIQERKG